MASGYGAPKSVAYRRGYIPKSIEELEQFRERQKINPKGIVSAVAQAPGLWEPLGESEQEDDAEAEGTARQPGLSTRQGQCAEGDH